MFLPFAGCGALDAEPLCGVLFSFCTLAMDFILAFQNSFLFLCFCGFDGFAYNAFCLIFGRVNGKFCRFFAVRNACKEGDCSTDHSAHQCYDNTYGDRNLIQFCWHLLVFHLIQGGTEPELHRSTCPVAIHWERVPWFFPTWHKGAKNPTGLLFLKNKTEVLACNWHVGFFGFLPF